MFDELPEETALKLLVDRYHDEITRLEDEEGGRLPPADAIEAVILGAVDAPRLAPTVVRWASMLAAGNYDRIEDLCLLAARTVLGFQRKSVRDPAAYFGTSVKRLVTRVWGEVWDTRRAG